MNSTESHASEIHVNFPGGKQVVSEVSGFRIESDQPPSAGGAGIAPAPFDLFLGALANCAGYFLLEFCQRREISTEGLGLTQQIERNPESRAVERIRQTITLPDGFPKKYESAALRAAASCSIKKLLENPPEVELVLAPTPNPE